MKDQGTGFVRARGFSLIELLVVMAIMATLIGLGVVGLPRLLRQGDETKVRTALTALATALEGYQNDPKNGDYPPSELDAESFPGIGAGGNEENLGIESVVVCLSRRGANAAIAIDQLEGFVLENLDGDRTQAQVTTFADKDLFELCDVWGTPLAYFHWRDYASIEAKSQGRISGVEDVLRAKPYRHPKTKEYFNKTSFQLISAGMDREFNTDDDVTNFKKE
jgi:prepilin-type N-terminal cleavage/methylation domain-containing protein